MTYLYRFDMLTKLREQSSDPVLRAKRVTEATGIFDHHQVTRELPGLQDNQGVYRFCFWKNWDAALRNMRLGSAHNAPWVLQRIKSDHPALRAFQKDNDEYLENDAWIYWQKNRVDASCPDWSPDGISHDDIDVLTPKGHWERLSTSELMRDASFDGWRCLAIQGANGPSPVFTRMLVRRTDEGGNQAWVLLRQTTGPWKSIWNNREAISEAVWHLIPEFRLIGLRQVRWVVSLECTDRVLSAEVFPALSNRTKPSLLEKVFSKRPLVQEDFLVDLRGEPAHLAPREQRLLYRDFGIGEVLLLNKRYEYSSGTLDVAGRNSGLTHVAA